MTVDNAIIRATREAKDTGASRAVISLDAPPEGRWIGTAPESYVDGGEYTAFDGRLYAVVDPSGAVEWHC